MAEKNLDVAARLRPALAGFEPYDPAFTPCRVNLSANENTHPLPVGVRAAIDAALLSTPLNRYPDPMANELRDDLAARHGLARDRVCVGNGGDELLFNLLFAFGRPGRALVTCPPDFSEYANFAAMCETEVRPSGATPRTSPLTRTPLVAAAADAALVFLTSPNNPTGDLLPHEPCAACSPRRTPWCWWTRPTSSLRPRARAWRAGWPPSPASWCCAPSPRPSAWRARAWATSWRTRRSWTRLRPCVRYTPLTCSRRPRASPRCAAATSSRPWSRTSWPSGRAWRGLAALPGVRIWPSEANFVLVRVPRAAEVRRRLRDEHSVLVRDFSAAPGLDDCLRLSVGTREENDALLDALATLVREEQ